MSSLALVLIARDEARCIDRCLRSAAAFVDEMWVLDTGSQDDTLSETRRTAGWTAVPVAAEIIRRVAPLMGLRPKLEPVVADAVTAASN